MAIALAKETPNARLLINEKKGREIARQLGLDITGLIGIMIEAKEKEMISSIRPTLDLLRTQAGFWISETLYQKVLLAVGE